MKYLNRAEAAKLALSVGISTLFACTLAVGQTPVKPPVKPAPKVAAAVKPAPAKPAPAPAKPAAVPVVNNTPKQSPAQPAGRTAPATTPQNAATSVTPAASRAQLPASGANTSPAAATSAATGASLSSTSLSSASTATNGATTYVGGSNAPRSAVAEAGVGSYNWSTLTLTAYGCSRSGTRVLCDFDISNQNSGQVTVGYWGDLALVDDGGKMSRRSNAFFMGNDGSQFDNAFVSPGQPVRYLMEFDDVAPSYTSIALVWQNKRIAPVAIAATDPNQPAGTIPGRGQAGGSSAAAGTTDANGNPLDKTNAAISNVQDKKNKAKSFWQQMKDTANAAKTTANPKQ